MAQRSFDVIVLGLGAMGSAAAYHLATRGKRVLGIEQYSPAHDRGSSHGDSRIIRQAYYEHPSYVPLVQRAYDLWNQLERDTGSRFLTLTGGLMIGAPGSPVVSGTLASATEHGLPHEILDATELRRRYPPLRPRSHEIAIFEQKAGFLNPEAAVRAHLAQAANNGAELLFEEPVTEWKAADGCVQVATSKGTYRADRLVVAAGAWALDELAQLGIPFEVRRHVMSWFQPAELAAFGADRFPVYLWDAAGDASADERHALEKGFHRALDASIFYGFPATAEGVKVALHSGGDLCTVHTVDRQVANRDVNELRHSLAPFIPALDIVPRRSAVCMYTMTPDEHFVVGLHPHSPEVAIAAGFSGHGFKFSSVIGEILADLSATGSTRHPITLFSPLRFSSAESAAEWSAPAPIPR